MRFVSIRERRLAEICGLTRLDDGGRSAELWAESSTAQRQTANAVRQARLFGTPHALARMRADMQLLAIEGKVKGSVEW